MSEERLGEAEQLLREVVYRAREEQAGLASLRTSTAPAGGDGRSGLCGLGAPGDRPEVELDLSPRGRELFERLFPPDRVQPMLPALRSAMAEWVERQDAMDRKRNHFLKDFRSRHGFERGRYTPPVLADFEAGLARLRAEEDAGRRAAAERLLSAGS